jgi:hypothetical protein
LKWVFEGKNKGRGVKIGWSGKIGKAETFKSLQKLSKIIRKRTKTA